MYLCEKLFYLQGMHAEFITLNSKIILKNGVLTEKKLKPDSERLNRSFAFAAIIIYLVLCLYKIVEEGKYWFILPAAIGLSWLIPVLKRYYRSVFVKAWKNYFKLEEIRTISTRPLENGLETELVLHLKNGRKKYLIFRDAENQLENFLQVADPEKNISPDR